MQNENYNVIGVMSGTSLDGVDIAHISFTNNDRKWSFEIKEAITIPYSAEWVEQLKAAIGYCAEELDKLNKDYTLLLSSIINDFIRKHELSGIDAVCSHGHTIQHRPHEGYTLQIGNLPEIAALTGQKVVCDFRVQDVEMGGQGAPLVPIGDRLLFSEYKYCLNLGGFSNISFEENNDRIAFDICPVNTLLNHYAGILGADYDDGGKLAAGGNIIPGLLDELNSLYFYALAYPKSLGFEFVKGTVLPLIEKYDAPAEDKLRTVTEHIALHIAATIKNNGEKGCLLITGGGAYNTFLINRLKQELPATVISIPDDKTIQFKEALIFALLGVLKLRNEINVLCSVTGASKDHSSGGIYAP
jgi:anhydro-N-acetylmuramic acid kinase